MSLVKVRLHDLKLKALYGETMHVKEGIVDRGVEYGWWERIPEVKEMVPEPGKEYRTKDFLSYRDVYGEDKKR